MLLGLALFTAFNFSCGPLKFQNVANLPNKQFDAVGGYLKNGSDSCYYVIGGKVNGTQTDKILKYKKNLNSWEQLAGRFPIQVSNASINQVNITDFYHLGGEYNGMGQHQIIQNFSNFYKINLNTNPITFETLNPFPDDGDFKGISRHSSILINGNLFVFGGIRTNYTSNTNFQIMNNLKIYIYNSSNQSWSFLTTQLQFPVEKGYIIGKNGYYYIFDGKIIDNNGFKVQVLKFSGNNFIYEGSFNVENMINGFEGLPFIYTRSSNDYNKIYYYPINGDCKIYIEEFNQNNPPSISNNFHFKIDFSDFNFPSNLEAATLGSIVHGDILSSNWMIISNKGNYFARPR